MNKTDLSTGVILVVIGFAVVCAIIIAGLMFSSNEDTIQQQRAEIATLRALNDELADQVDAARAELIRYVTEDEEVAATQSESAAVALETVDIVAEDTPEGTVALGRFKVTHYCTCAACCGVETGLTKSGRAAVAGYSIAVDPSVIPLGSTVFVDYGDGVLHECRADDTGGAVKGNTIDLCVADHETALALGIRYATVYVAEALK